MDCSYDGEADLRSADQQIYRLSLNQVVQCRAHKSLPFDPFWVKRIQSTNS
jgi:hypothetical protein